MHEFEKVRDLEKTGILRIMLLLKKDGPLLTSKIQAMLEISNDAYYSSRNKLMDLKLIEQATHKYSMIGPYQLTEKGEKIAQSLMSIYKIL